MLVSDNCTTAVNHEKSDWYTTSLNTTYHEMAEHYNLAIIPARVRKPNGLMASNYDITDLYIDGILKVLDHDINRLGVVLDEMAAIAGDSVKVTVTVSADEAALPHNVKKYL